ALERAGCEISVSSSGAETDHSDLAIGVGLSAQELHRARDVAQNLLVGNAAGRAYAGADIIGTARTFAEIEMRRDCRQSMMGELAGHLFDPFIPARQVMDEHPAGQRPAERARVIGLAHIAFMAAKGDGFSEHAFISHAFLTCLIALNRAVPPPPR